MSDTLVSSALFTSDETTPLMIRENALRTEKKALAAIISQLVEADEQLNILKLDLEINKSSKTNLSENISFTNDLMNDTEVTILNKKGQ